MNKRLKHNFYALEYDNPSASLESSRVLDVEMPLEEETLQTYAENHSRIIAARKRHGISYQRRINEHREIIAKQESRTLLDKITKLQDDADKQLECLIAEMREI